MPIQKVCSKIGWSSIQIKYKIKTSFKRVLRRLKSKGYIEDHGKSCAVASLSKLGVDYVRGLIIEEKSKKTLDNVNQETNKRNRNF